MFSASVCLLVCWSVGLCIPTYHVILMSCRLLTLPCDFTLVDLTAALSTGVATVTSMRY